MSELRKKSRCASFENRIDGSNDQTDDSAHTGVFEYGEAGALLETAEGSFKQARSGAGEAGNTDRR